MPMLNLGAVGTIASTASHDVPYGIMFGENTRQSKTFSSAGNRKTFTLSVWVKLSKITTGTQYFFGGANAGNNYALLRYENYNFEWIAYNSGSAFAYLRTTALFRDPNAWYNIVISSDTTQGTAANRTKMYVNGVQITNFQTENYPAQDGSYVFNDNVIHTLGAFYDGSSYGSPLEGYMCEVVSIDGQQLDPTSFGEFDTDSGIWKPKDPSGLTFGTNGFYLNFATRATDAIDASGQGNNFSSDNVASTDWSLDTCTNNYCTLNPLFRNQTRTNQPTYANGNTKASGVGDAMAEGSMLVYGGKWYYETYTSGDTMFGWGQAGKWPGDAPGQSYTDTGSGVGLHANGKILYKGSYITGSSQSWSTGGDTIMIAIDFDNQKFYHGKNGNWAHSMNPAGNSGGEGLDSDFWNGDGWVPAFRASNGGSDYSEMNFGNPLRSISSGNADDNSHGNFEYDVPAGFYALNTKNLAEHGG